MYGTTSAINPPVSFSLSLVLIVAVLAGCGSDSIGNATPTLVLPSSSPKVGYNFRAGAQGWLSGFADYPSGAEQSYKFDAGTRALPEGVQPAGTGYYISGSNGSDDLYMFLKRKLGQADGVQPNTTYRLKFTIVLASGAPSGCTGIGGAPGEGVTLKAGGSDIEPQPVLKDGTYRMNVDKGEQGTGRHAGAVLGDIANGKPCSDTSGNGQPYVSITREHTSEFPVKSSSHGQLWLLVGTDSGFEGATALYYQQIRVELLPER